MNFITFSSRILVNSSHDHIFKIYIPIELSLKLLWIDSFRVDFEKPDSIFESSRLAYITRHLLFFLLSHAFTYSLSRLSGVRTWERFLVGPKNICREERYEHNCMFQEKKKEEEEYRRENLDRQQPLLQPWFPLRYLGSVAERSTGESWRFWFFWRTSITKTEWMVKNKVNFLKWKYNVQFQHWNPLWRNIGIRPLTT